MSGLASTLSRIAELDSLVRGFNPGWRGASAGYVTTSRVASTATTDGAADGSAFALALEEVSLPPESATGVEQGAASGMAGNVADASEAGAISFVSPLPAGRLTLGFGATSLAVVPPAVVDGVRYAHFHQGIDLAAARGTAVRAAAAGTVIAAGRATDGAVVVRVRHADGSETLYGHLEPALRVKTGQRVEAGDVLGQVGMTGNTTGPHLHFALYAADRTPIDPAVWLARGRLPGTAGTGATKQTKPSPPVTPAPVTGEGAPSDGRLTTDGLARFDRIASKIPYAALIREAAVANGIDPLLLTALVRAESGFHPNAVSRCGAMGLTQLMPATARSLGVDEPFDPRENLMGGARYLARQLKRFGRVDYALAAYQAGPGAVARHDGVPDSKSTQAYVRHISASWQRYREGKTA